VLEIRRGRRRRGSSRVWYIETKIWCEWIYFQIQICTYISQKENKIIIIIKIK
jgi:hypothetical protein